MKILGARALNANNYSKISLYKNINVLGSSYKGNLKVSDEFTKSLKGKTDKEKRDEVTRYFLRNHDISMLFQDCEDIAICSKDGVELFISRNQELSKEVLNEAISKYEYDRMKAYAESDVDFYWMMTDYGFDTVGMGYHVGQVDDFKRELEGLPKILSNKKCMVLDIGVRKKYEDRELKLFEINPIEKKFFARMLEDIEEASFYCNSNDFCLRFIYPHHIKPPSHKMPASCQFQENSCNKRLHCTAFQKHLFPARHLACLSSWQEYHRAVHD